MNLKARTTFMGRPLPSSGCVRIGTWDGKHIRLEPPGKLFAPSEKKGPKVQAARLSVALIGIVASPDLYWDMEAVIAVRVFQLSSKDKGIAMRTPQYVQCMNPTAILTLSYLNDNPPPGVLDAIA
jgi:hypothetical protein